MYTDWPNQTSSKNNDLTLKLSYINNIQIKKLCISNIKLKIVFGASEGSNPRPQTCWQRFALPLSYTQMRKNKQTFRSLC